MKTDRRDAVMLAKLHRPGELTAVWVPDAAHEALRSEDDLLRLAQRQGSRQPRRRKWSASCDEADRT